MKKAIIPEMKIVMKIIVKSREVIVVKISWTATAAPVLVFWIE